MFQAQQKFQFSAALDEEGSIAEVFGVGSIPHLCIISRDGTVQVVHVGVGDGTEEAIRAEVDALVAGRNLAVDGLPE
jgi:hypothetical protein